MDIVKISRILIVIVALAAIAGAAFAFYPPFKMLTLVAVGRSPVCPLPNALRSQANVDERMQIKDRILAGSKLLKEESGLELWETPKGQYWIPRGNRYVLPFNLAEMEQRIYFQGEHTIRPGDIVLDCGASNGDFTQVALQAGAAKVIAIEIAPSSAECIRRNLAKEITEGRVVVYPKGVWDKDDQLTLNVDDTNFAANSVVISTNAIKPTIRVPLTTIDKIVSELNLPRVDFIKMDIEGAELKAIQGGQETIKKFKPRISITAEHNPDDEKTIPAALRLLRPDYQMECGQCLEHANRIKADILFFR